ncbi:MAG TPA: hypothetical protein VHV55_14950 [Pirellulales bacterium]|jgi:hypothetical protein|nr:hypothetical protein [Pirellulales bacterium]
MSDDVSSAAARMPLDPVEVKLIEACRKGLGLFHSEVGRLIRVAGPQPRPDSQAEQEYKTYVRPESISSAWSAAGLLIEFAGDHVTAFIKTITSPVETVAGFTCVRSMLESCAIAAWFADPAVDAEMRTRRVFAYRFESIEQQITLLRTSGAQPGAIPVLEARADDLEAEAIRLGFPRVTDRHGHRIGIGVRMPSATQIIDEMLDLAPMYRLLSAIAHGHHWAITQLGYKEIDASPSAPDMKVLQKRINPQGIVVLSHTALRGLARPIWNLARFCGWDLLRIEEAIENAADEAAMPMKPRFWRTPLPAEA